MISPFSPTALSLFGFKKRERNSAKLETMLLGSTSGSYFFLKINTISACTELLWLTMVVCGLQQFYQVHPYLPESLQSSGLQHCYHWFKKTRISKKTYFVIQKKKQIRRKYDNSQSKYSCKIVITYIYTLS